MNIVAISGGLGNQMFQYALCMAYKHRGIQIKLDISKYSYYKIHNNYELHKIFGVDDEIAILEEIKLYGYRRDNRLIRWMQKTRFCKKSVYIENSTRFNPNVLQQDEKYIRGYWQTEKYFDDIRDSIIKKFQFPPITDQKLQEIVNHIKNTNSVSFHIRRGDYLNHPLYRGICDSDYYVRAYEYLKVKLGDDLKIFVFSNDIDWVKENIKFPDMIFVDINSGENSYRDMQLMSLCKHNVIANSTFSWWGAWLNKNYNKFVIAPQKWTNGSKEEWKDILPNNWVKL